MPVAKIIAYEFAGDYSVLALELGFMNGSKSSGTNVRNELQIGWVNFE